MADKNTEPVIVTDEEELSSSDSSGSESSESDIDFSEDDQVAESVKTEPGKWK